MTTPKKKPEKCLVPVCERRAACRGLCVPCYNVALNFVKVGKVTWAELECKGKCLPPKRHFGPRSRAAQAAKWFVR